MLNSRALSCLNYLIATSKYKDVQSYIFFPFLGQGDEGDVF